MTGLACSPRVVVVVSQLGLGGAERQTFELLRQLRDTAWAPVRVICLSTVVSPYDDAVRALGYELTVIERAGGFDVGRCVALHQLLRQDRADVVHAVNWFAAAYAVVARPRHARVVSSIRNSHLASGHVRRLVFPYLIRRSAAVLANSARGRQMVAATCRIPADRVALVPNGVDVDALRRAARPGALRRELGIPSETPIVVYVGRKARVKNIPRLLGVTRAVLRAHPDVRIVIVGDGLGPDVVAGSDLAGAPRLHCLGPRRDVPSLFGDADVLLLTSDNEGMPNVVLEALASGVPVVATDVGDLAQMVPDGCGILAPPDVDALAAAVGRVLAGASAYREAAERHVASVATMYSCRAVAEQTVDVWRGCLRGRGARTADRHPRIVAPDSRSRSVPS